MKPTEAQSPARVVGLDIGSVASKGVLVEGSRLIASCVLPTGWHPGEAARAVLSDLLGQPLPERLPVSLAATGYGKHLIPFPARATNEILCHAAGARLLWPEVRTVVDVGGQDCKIISLEASGEVHDFAMNDKCAAGTGRFLQSMAAALGLDLPALDREAAQGSPCDIGSVCAVFAESEVVGLLASGVPRRDIAAGVISALAHQLLALAGRRQIVAPVGLTGGGGLLHTLARVLGEELGQPVLTTAQAQLVGALGATAVAGWAS